VWVNRSELFFMCEHQKSQREVITVTSDSTSDHADENGSSNKFDSICRQLDELAANREG